MGLEDIEPDHWIAYALDLPGCFSAGATPQEAVRLAPERIANHLVWRAEHDCSLPVADGPIGVDVVETFSAFPSSINPNYIVNAFFADDERPLPGWEVRALLPLLDWTQQDLLAATGAGEFAPRSAQRDESLPASIAEIIAHLARAENWYFANLGLGLEPAQLPADPLARLAAVHANTRAHLAGLAGVERISTLSDERWSARKVVRRTLWHRREHTQEIAKRRGMQAQD